MSQSRFEEESRQTRPSSDRLSGLLVLFLVFVGTVHAVLLITTYSDVLMHPHNVTFHNRIALRDGVGITRDLFRKPFAVAKEVHGAEFRDRFLMYFLLFLDQKVRYGSYQILPPHPSASIIWPLTLVLTPYLVHRFVLRVTGDRRTALIALALFLSSVGYLSTIAMNFSPAKPMSLFFFAAMLNVVLSISSALRPGELLYRGPGWPVALLLTLLFCSLFFDESIYVAYAVIPVLFPGLFVEARSLRKNHGKGLAPTIGNAVLYATPAVLFGLFSIVIVPIISVRIENYQFDPFAPTGLGRGRHFHLFKLLNVYWNFMSMVGTSLVPRQVSALLPVPPNWNFYDQRING